MFIITTMKTSLILQCDQCGYKLETADTRPSDDEFFRAVFTLYHVTGNHARISWPKLMKEQNIKGVLAEFETATQPRTPRITRPELLPDLAS